MFVIALAFCFAVGPDPAPCIFLFAIDPAILVAASVCVSGTILVSILVAVTALLWVHREHAGPGCPH